MATEKCGNTSVLQRERESTRERRKRWNKTKDARKEERKEERKGGRKRGDRRYCTGELGVGEQTSLTG